ncbi:MAG TPA: group III truncated hemoglobin [Aliiroseovarius sp.]|nr:group III truncated hemoglobin [Aliiroseovarius sp.]
MASMPPRFEITPEQIDAMMTAFYTEIRAHPVLGPVFACHVQDWDAHEAKIASFWRNAILHERGYDGRPQQVHMQRANVMPDHFPIWLDLFEEVAFRVLPEQPARSWVALARKIGDGMQMGIAQVRAPSGAVPNLRVNAR